MFGPTKKELKVELKRLMERINGLEQKWRPDHTTTDEAVKELLRRIDPKDLLDRVLLAQGLTVDDLIKKAVRECIREDGLLAQALEGIEGIIGESLSKTFDSGKLAPTVAKEITDVLLEDGDFVERVEGQVTENLNTEEFNSRVAKLVSMALLEGDNSITDEIVEKVADSVYENLDDSELHPIIGEKVVAALQSQKRN